MAFNYDTWGGSWGASWANSWGVQSGPTPTPGRSGLGGDDVPRRRNPNRGWNKAEWKARVKDSQDAVEETLREAYASITGEGAPLSVLAQVDAIVRPAAKKKVSPEAPQLRINWTAIANDYRRTNAILKLWREEQELRDLMDDDEDVIMLAGSL